jgi:hypothetical protein
MVRQVRAVSSDSAVRSGGTVRSFRVGSLKRSNRSDHAVASKRAVRADGSISSERDVRFVF